MASFMEVDEEDSEEPSRYVDLWAAESAEPFPEAEPLTADAVFWVKQARHYE